MQANGITWYYEPMRADPKRRRLSPKGDDGKKVGFTGAFTVKLLPDVLLRLDAVVARDPNHLGRSAIVAKWIEEKLATLPVGQGSSAGRRNYLSKIDNDLGRNDGVTESASSSDDKKDRKAGKKNGPRDDGGRG